MKTPRELLFARHQHVTPKLDDVRHNLIEQLASPRTSLVLRLWQELIMPYRRIWAGLACIWVGLIIFNVSQGETSQVAMSKSSSSSMAVTLIDQQKILNEVLADRSSLREADRPRSFSPKPRTETLQFITV